jgi:hypothetical protein
MVRVDEKEDSDFDCNERCAIRAVKLLSPQAQPASQSLHAGPRDAGYLTGHVSLSPTPSIWDPKDAQSFGANSDDDDDFKSKLSKDWRLKIPGMRLRLRLDKC